MAINLLYVIASVSRPFIPNTSKTILRALGKPDDLWWPQVDVTHHPLDPNVYDVSADSHEAKMLGWSLTMSFQDQFKILQAGQKIAVPDLLFTKIEDEKIKEWETRFGGVG
jgi:methionyl-tRNA synthetase